MKKIIDRLFDGPIDLIGDIHGELESLNTLLKHLGYDEDANHPEGRRLVFLGDLVDRGPHSISLVKRVKRWVEEKKAQCIIGNHELNLINSDKGHRKKQGNHWFAGQEEGMSPDNKGFIHVQELAKPEDQEWILAFLESLPIALENDELGVVHACWDQKSIDMLKEDQEHGKVDTLERFLHYRNQIQEKIAKHHIVDQDQIDLMKQNEHPLKVLTSGLEEHHSPAYYAGGKMRNQKRKTWWHEYQGKKIIIGHYWRKRIHVDISDLPIDKQGVPLIFDHNYPFHWLGQGDVMCIDYSIGMRFLEREKNQVGQNGIGLCALRWPEQKLYFDDGFETEIQKINLS